MDSKDRLESNVPAVPLRVVAARPALLDAVHMGKSAAAEPAKSVNVARAAVRALTRHWWQILLLWATATGAICYVVATKVRPLYESSSMLSVTPSRQNPFGDGGSGENIDRYMETQITLVNSSNVLSHALSNPRVAAQPSLQNVPDAEGELRRSIQPTVQPGTYLMRVSMKSGDPLECATLVNAVVQSYLGAADEWSHGSTNSQIKRIESYQRQLLDQANEKESELMRLATKGNITLEGVPDTAITQNSPTSVKRNPVTIEKYKEVQNKLFELTIDLGKAEAVLNARQGETTAETDNGQLDKRAEGLLKKDPALADLRREIGLAQNRYDDAVKHTRSESDPSRANPKAKLAKLRKAYAELQQQRREEILAELRDGGQGDDASIQLRAARDKVQDLNLTKVTLENTLRTLEVNNRQDSTDAVMAALTKEKLNTIRALQGEVNKKLEQLRFELNGEDRVSLLNPAKVSYMAVSDNRKKYLLAAPVGVLLFVCGLFVMLEVKIGRVSDLEDLAKQVPVEVFALPPLPGPRLEAGQRGAREREARLQEFLQSLDHLRVALTDEPGAGGGGRCLMITSATASEGKTTLSAQLSACCAKAGVSTLLVDADMRRATLSRMLNEDKTPGLSDVLQGDLAADDATVAIPDAGFHLLPAGTPGRDPSWLLKGQRIGQILTRYRQLFDLIIIDTPPVLPVPDALTLGRWTDGAVLATRFDISRFPLVSKARARINSAGIPLIKTVVNGVKTSRFYTGYAGGGGYGYGYGGYGGYANNDRAAVNPPEPSPTA